MVGKFSLKLTGTYTCGHCIVMSTSCECGCCAEIDKVAEKMQEGPHEVTCITAHEGFEAVCLNVWYYSMVIRWTFLHSGEDC